MGVVQTHQRFRGKRERKRPKTGRSGVQVVQTHAGADGRDRSPTRFAGAELRRRLAGLRQRAQIAPEKQRERFERRS